MIRLLLLLICARNSARVFSLSRNAPNMRLVVILVLAFFTPRIMAHMWAPSTTTATPWGCRASWMKLAICEVICSWICSRRANISTIRGILLNPTTLPSGM